MLLFVVVLAVYTLAVGVEFRAFEQHLRDGDPAKLKTPLLGQSFVATRDNLSRIEMQLTEAVTRTLPADMSAMLVRGEGPGTLPPKDAVPGTSKVVSEPGSNYLSVSFPPIADSGNMTYTFMLLTSGYSVNSVLLPAWSTADALSSGAMYTEDGAQDGDLTITAYYRYNILTLLSDVWGAVSGRLPVLLVWLLLLLLPGMALLLWLPNGLGGEQRLLAAPGLSALLLPVIFLLASWIRLPIGSIALWVFLGMCAVAVVARIALKARKGDSGRWTMDGLRTAIRVPSAFWLSFAIIMIFTVVTRLVSLRDIQAGVGIDAYHHTLITNLFLIDGSIPTNYEPFAPLASYTYHFGFHALTAVIAWLTGNTQPTGLMTLVPQVGQIAGSVLPIPGLTLFGWRVLGNRWIGLMAGALAGLVSIVPAFYLEWSRYTQGLGLAVLPVAWVLFVEAVGRPVADAGRSRKAEGKRQKAEGTVGHLLSTIYRPPSVVALAVIASVGLFLTHYRITVLYAGFACLYVLWIILVEMQRANSGSVALRISRFALYSARAAILGILTLAVLLPWLLNLNRNFVINRTGNVSLDVDSYYATADRLGGVVLSNPSIPILAILCALGLVMLGLRLWWNSLAGLAISLAAGGGAVIFALYVRLNYDPPKLESNLQGLFLGLSPVTWFLLIEIIALCALLVGGAMRAGRSGVSKETVVLLPALVWLVLGLWSSPQLLPSPLRLPYAGYLDAVTLASSAWLPACLLAGYALVNSWRWLARLVEGRRWLMPPSPASKGQKPVRNSSLVIRLSSFVLPALMVASALGGLASGMALAPARERRPYIEPADMQALTWMRDNLPANSFVLANSFHFPWSPTQVLGLDSGLWIPVVTGLHTSVPPITAYNEKPANEQYFSRIQALGDIAGRVTDWGALKTHGVTHIFIGTRAAGDGLSAPELLKDPHVQLLFHRDAVWLFEVVGSR